MNADTLFEKIGKVFDVKAGAMISDIKFDITNNTKDIKLDIENSAGVLKSEIKLDIEYSANALKSDIAKNADKIIDRKLKIVRAH